MWPIGSTPAPATRVMRDVLFAYGRDVYVLVLQTEHTYVRSRYSYQNRGASPDANANTLHCNSSAYFNYSSKGAQTCDVLVLCCRHNRLLMMNPHVYLLGFLIGSSGLESAFSFSLRPTPPLCSTSSNLVSQQQQPHPLVAQPLPLAPHHDHRQNHRCCALSTPTTVLQARRGGRGRRRGRTEYDDDAAATTAVKEKPAQQQRQGAAGEATLAVQHAADEELLKVAHDHLAVLRPGVLSQALLRIAKV